MVTAAVDSTVQDTTATQANQQVNQSQYGRDANASGSMPLTDLQRDQSVANYLQRLSSQERQLLSTTTLSDVRTTVAATEVATSKRQTGQIMKRVNPLVDGIVQYTGVIEVFVQISPLFLAPIWGSMKLLFQTLQRYQDYINKTIEHLERIQLCLPRFEEYVAIFPKNARIQYAAQRHLSLILEFCLKAAEEIDTDGAKFFSRRYLRVKTRPLLANFDQTFATILAKLDLYKSQVEDEAKAAGLSTAAESQKILKQSQDQLLQRQAALQQVSDQSVTYSENILKELRQRDITSWIIGTRAQLVDLNQETLDELGRRFQPGTCGWLLNDARFVDWKLGQTLSPSLLWLTGPLGCGKSVAASRCVIEMQKSRAPALTLYHCCSYSRSPDSSLESALRAWILIILASSKPWPLLDRMSEMQKESARSAASQDELRTIFNELLQSSAVQVAAIVVDALDEAGGLDQFALALPQFAERIPVLVTSRPSSSVRKAMASSGAVEVSMEPQNTMYDILAVTRQWTASNPMLSEELKHLTVELVPKKSKGMFLCCSLMLKDLERQADEMGYLARLSATPEGLDAFLDKCLGSLKAASSSEQQLAQSILRWVSFARRPLEKTEIQAALAVRPNPGASISRVFHMDRLMELCEPFLQISSAGHLYFIHLSVLEFIQRQFFTSPDISADEQEIHSKLTEICLRYILNFKPQDSLYGMGHTDLHQNYAFLDYAAVHWMSHMFLAGSPHPILSELIHELFTSDAGVRWIEMLDIAGIFGGSLPLLNVQADLRKWLEDNEKDIKDQKLSVISDYSLVALHKQAVAWNISAKGRSHIDTARALRALGLVNSNLGQMTEGLRYYNEAIRIQEQHLTTARDKQEYYSLLFETGRCCLTLNLSEPKGRRLLDSAYQQQLGLLGSKHPDTLDTLAFRVQVLYFDGHTEEALEMLRRAIGDCTEVLGPDHHTTLRNYHNLGKFLRQSGNLPEALQTLKHAEERRRVVFGSKNQSRLRSLQCLGQVYLEMKDYDKALDATRQAVAGLRELHRGKSEYEAGAVESVGLVLEEMGRLEEAESKYREALDIMSHVETDEETPLETEELLADILTRRGQLDEAARRYRHIYSSYNRIRGSLDDETVRLAGILVGIETLLWWRFGPLYISKWVWRQAMKVIALLFVLCSLYAWI